MVDAIKEAVCRAELVCLAIGRKGAVEILVRLGASLGGGDEQGAIGAEETGGGFGLGGGGGVGLGHGVGLGENVDAYRLEGVKA